MPVSLRAILLRVRHSDFRTSLRQAPKKRIFQIFFIIILFRPCPSDWLWTIFRARRPWLSGTFLQGGRPQASAHTTSSVANSKHWFTTSFLGGRCRKAVLGVWLSGPHTLISVSPPPPSPPPPPPPPPHPLLPAPAPRSPDAAYLAGSISDFVRVGKNEATDVHFALLCLR